MKGGQSSTMCMMILQGYKNICILTITAILFAPECISIPCPVQKADMKIKKVISKK